MGWAVVPGPIASDLREHDLRHLVVPAHHRNIIGVKPRFSIHDAERACDLIGIDLGAERFDLSDVLVGMAVELEHGTRTPDLDVTGDDPVLTAKIAIAHLREIPDYYERLARMEAIGAAAWAVSAEPDLGIVSARRFARPLPR